MTSSKKEFSPAEQSGMTVGKSAVPQQEGLPPAPASPPGVPAGLIAGFRRIDQVRQWQGRMLDGFGLGPVETPCRIALETPGVRLMAYGPTQSGAGRGALLIVPAPIKRPYIWDMAPDVSVVRRCRDAGFRVYVAAWTDPTDAEDGFGLADYAGRLISACLDRIVEETGARTVALAGHSLGGTLAAIYAAREPRRVRGLVLVEAPLHFGTASGDFAPMVAAAPSAAALRAEGGSVPGSLISMVSARASPHTFHWERWTDLIGCLGNAAAMESHVRVERWTLDEFPMPGQLFEEVVDGLYRDDAFMKGTLMVAGRPARPQDITAAVLAVVDPRSTIIPPGAIAPFMAALPNPANRLLNYDGDTGVALQHVGALVGANAHARLWPEILSWLSGLPRE